MQELHLFIDADTIVIQAAMTAQTKYCVYKDGEFIEPTPSRKQWKEANPKLDDKKYEFREEARLITSRGAHTTQTMCRNSIKKKIDDITFKYRDHKIWIVLEGEGNYRQDMYPDYKGNRKGDIILRDELVEWCRKYYGNQMIFAEGCETDDIVAQYMWAGHKNFLKTGVHNYMIASCDKDLKTVAGKLYNYKSNEEHILSEFDADKWFCTQLLWGDATDNIKGINGGLTRDFVKSRDESLRYSSKGVGEKTAKGLMELCSTSRGCFMMVVDAYKDVHEDDWMIRLREEAIALRMQHTKGEMYDIKKHLDHLKIQYGDFNE